MAQEHRWAEATAPGPALATVMLLGPGKASDDPSFTSWALDTLPLTRAPAQSEVAGSRPGRRGHQPRVVQHSSTRRGLLPTQCLVTRWVAEARCPRRTTGNGQERVPGQGTVPHAERAGHTAPEGRTGPGSASLQPSSLLSSEGSLLFTLWCPSQRFTNTNLRLTSDVWSRHRLQPHLTETAARGPAPGHTAGRQPPRPRRLHGSLFGW